MTTVPRTARVLYFDPACLPHADHFFERIPSSRYYDHRALLLADEADFVLLNSPVDPAYLAYLRRLRLGPAPDHVFLMNDDSREGTLRALSEILNAEKAATCRLVPLFHHRHFSELAVELRERARIHVAYPEDSAEAALRYASKAEGRRLAEELGLPVPESIVMEADASAIVGAVQQRFSRDGALVIKGSWGNGGSETRKLTAPWNEQSLLDELSTLDPEGPVIVEKSIDPNLATNIMLRICEETGRIEVLGISDQLIEAGTRHAGNTFPSRSAHRREIVRAGIAIAEALRSEGFSGYAGVDFIETLPVEAATPRYYFLELNPRVNGSLHPLFVMRKLNAMQDRQGNPTIRAFRQLSLPLKSEPFAGICDLLERDAFDPRTGRGIILHSPAFLGAGSLPLLLLGESEKDLDRLQASSFRKLSPLRG